MKEREKIRKNQKGPAADELSDGSSSGFEEDGSSSSDEERPILED